MKKKSPGLDKATSLVFNDDSEAQLWFRMDQGLQQVVGTAGDEYLILE